MRKFLISILVLFCHTVAWADDIFEILPTKVVAGSTSIDGNTISVHLNNDNVFLAFQFDVYLPKGVYLDNEPVELSMDRFPYTTGRNGIKFEHQISDIYHEDKGRYRILIYSDTNAAIKGNSGELLKLYYTSDAELSDKPMPIVLKGIVMTINGKTEVKIDECSSFLYTDKTDFSKSDIDLSGLSGRVFADVAEETGKLLSGNESITSLSLPSVTRLDGSFSSGNQNMLTYLPEGAVIPRDVKNVVVGGVCGNLSLTDNMPFNAPKAFTATTASYNRTVPGAGWYSMCLPFAPTVDAGMTVEKFVSVDVDAKTVTFDAEPSPQAYVPYIFKTDATDVCMSGTDVEIAATPAAMANGVFVGTLAGIGAPSIDGYFVLKSDGTGFAVATETAYATPFRAVINTVGGMKGVRQLSVIHGGDTTGIGVVDAENSGDGDVYNLQGMKVTKAGKGIYIRNGKKYVK